MRNLVLFLSLLFLASPVWADGLSLTSQTAYSSGEYHFLEELICLGQEDQERECRSGRILGIFVAQEQHVGTPSFQETYSIEFNLTNRTWDASSVRQIYNDPSYSTRWNSGGYIGDRLYLFAKRDQGGGSSDTIDWGYITSDDDGLTWSSFNSVYAPGAAQTGGPSNGRLVRTDDPLIWLMPFFHYNGVSGLDWYEGYFKTENAGQTWSVSDGAIFNNTDSTKFGEIACTYTGNGKIICLIRDNDGDLVAQSVSTDNGETWTNPSSDFTNMGASSNIKVPSIFHDKETNRLLAVFMDRNSSGAMRLSYTYPDLVFVDPDNWVATVNIDSGYTANGYSHVLKISPTEYLIAWSKEISATQADVQYAIYQVNDISDHIRIE